MLQSLVRGWRQWRCQRIERAIARWEGWQARNKGPYKEMGQAVAACYAHGYIDIRLGQLKTRLAYHQQRL
jgi:hypothetical protein